MPGGPPTRSSIRACSANPAFRAAIIGGTLFRIGNGAVPFLLPLMFQLGFGMTPFQSGMLTFASALGAIMMKFLAPITLRLGGFRNVLICGGDRRLLLHRHQWLVHAADAVGGDHRGAGRSGPPALAVLHLDQRAGVRRHRRQGRQPGDRDLGRVAADQRGARRRGRRRDPRSLHLHHRPAARPAGLLDRLHDRRGDHGASPPSRSSAWRATPAARCRASDPPAREATAAEETRMLDWRLLRRARRSSRQNGKLAASRLNPRRRPPPCP